MQSSHLERVLLREFPEEVETVISKTGRPEIATDPMGVEMSDIFVMLHPEDEWRVSSKAELVEEMEEVLEREVPGVAFGFSQPIELRVSELIAGVRSDVAIQIFGDDLESLDRPSQRRSSGCLHDSGRDRCQGRAGLWSADPHRDGRSRIRCTPRCEWRRRARRGRGAGRPAGRRGHGGRAAIRASGAFSRGGACGRRVDPENPSGSRRRQAAALGELAQLDTETEAAQISREWIKRRVSVELNVRGRDVASVVADARAAIAESVEIPPGTVIEWGGQFENLERASRRLFVLVPLSLLLIFVLLFAAFNAGRPAVLIFLNVPLAAAGGVFSLALRGMPFSISAGVGFIALFGIAVMNGVVLLSYARKLEHEEGMAPFAAAREAALVRMRPVLTTALVAAIGFVPMAIATGSGAEVQRPLASVVIGGLVTATLLTLFVLPVVYGGVSDRPSES